jgi:hypothetical protein
MKTKSLLYLLSASVLMASCGEKDKGIDPVVIEWQSVTGGYHIDKAAGVAQGKNGEYLVVGSAFSHNTGDITGSYGSPDSVIRKLDAVITKLDANGNKQWVKVFGGTDLDEAKAIAVTPDGDFIVAGYTKSNDGDLAKAVVGWSDFWIMKIDTDGKVKWSKSYGSTDIDQANAVVATTDGGCVVTGFTEGNNGDVSGNHSKYQDIWIVKLDAQGNKQWAKTYGGSQWEVANSITASPDGGYAIAGYALSNDGDVKGIHGSHDIWVIKVDANGNKLWDKCYGGKESEVGRSIKSTPDGGFVVAGSTNSVDGDISGVHHISGFGSASSDACVLKLDIAGNIQWAKAYGGNSGEIGNSVTTSSDGGYVFTGSVGSSDGDVSGRPASEMSLDYWLVKLDGDGNLKWNNCYGSTGGDESAFVISTSDNGYVMTGYIHRNDQDVNVPTYGQFDWWTLKIKSL